MSWRNRIRCIFFKELSDHRLKIFSLLTAALVAVVLLCTAFAKITYPIDSLQKLDRLVGVAEVLLAFSLILFHRYPQIWMLLAATLAAWAGYALFWFTTALPCGCMGELLVLPNGFSLAFDLIFFSLALILARLLGGKKEYLYPMILLSLLLGLGGYFFAEWNYGKL